MTDQIDTKNIDKDAIDGATPAVQQPPAFTAPRIALAFPDPLPPWALRRPLMAIWYIVSRAGDHGRMRPFRRLTHITKYIFLGGQISNRGWRVLQSWGVVALVNMRVEWDDRRSRIETPHYLWLPTIDGTPPTVEQLAKGAAFIHEQVQADRPVYVHCAAGMGRSPTQVIAYMMTRGMSSDAAIACVVNRRPFITLSARQKLRLQEFDKYRIAHQIDYSADEQHDPLNTVFAAANDVPAIGTDHDPSPIAPPTATPARKEWG